MGRSFSLVAGRRIAAIIALILAAGYTFHAWQELGFGRWRAPGAAIFPIAVGIMIVIASIAILFERKDSAEGLLEATFRLPGGADLKRLGGVLIAFAIYFVAMNYIGHLVASALFLFAAMAILSDRSKVRLAIYAVLLAVAFEVFFVRFLQVQMPYGLVRLY